MASWYGQEPAELEEKLGTPQPADDNWDDDAPLFPTDAQEDRVR